MAQYYFLSPFLNISTVNSNLTDDTFKKILNFVQEKVIL